MGHERGWLWGPPQYREARGGERGRQGARGGREGMEMGHRARGGQRVRGNFNMLRPFRVAGGTLMELGRRHFIMAYNPYTVGGNIHGIRKKKFYHGIRPFRVGKEAFMESGRGNFIMRHERRWLWGSPPNIGRREGARWGDRHFIMAYKLLRGGGDTHGIRKKKNYHGIRPFRVGGGTFMESGRGNFIMGHERGWLWGPPNTRRREGARAKGERAREGARGGERGREGGEREARGGREGGESGREGGVR